MHAKPLDIETLLPPGGWASLSVDIRRRFAPGHAPVVYRGALTARRSLLGAVFAWAAAPFGQPLFSRNGEDIETEVHVYPDGRGGVVWERWLLQAGRPAHCVRSTKAAGRRGGLEERSDRGLGMELDVFVADGALVFQSRRYFMQLGRFRLNLPAWAAPGTCRVTHTSLGPGLFRFTLDMHHPLWGATFQQHGMFTDPDLAAAPAQLAQPVSV